MVFWDIMFGVLCVEVLSCLTLCIPVSIAWRARMVKKLSQFILLTHFVYYVRAFFFMILPGAFIFSVSEMMKQTENYRTIKAENPMAIDKALSQMFRAQRNMYISAFGLIFVFVLNRFANFVTENAWLLEDLQEARDSGRAKPATKTTAGEDDGDGDSKRKSRDTATTAAAAAAPAAADPKPEPKKTR